VASLALAFAPAEFKQAPCDEMIDVENELLGVSREGERRVVREGNGDLVSWVVTLMRASADKGLRLGLNRRGAVPLPIVLGGRPH
jgi:hypothetical protein